MMPHELVDQLIAARYQLSLRELAELLAALVEPAQNLDACSGNYVARAAAAIRERQTGLLDESLPSH